MQSGLPSDNREAGAFPVRSAGLSFEAPVLASVDPWALALAAGAAIAIFRFNAGMLQTLAACASAGVLLYLSGVI